MIQPDVDDEELEECGLEELYPEYSLLPQTENDDVVDVIHSDYVIELRTGGWKKQLSELASGRYLVEVYWEPWIRESERPQTWEETFPDFESAKRVYDSLTDMRKVRKSLRGGAHD